MNSLMFLFVAVAILACKAAGQVSPCPESFQYQNDNGFIFGVIYLKPGYTGRITTSVGFTVATQLPSSYVGKLSLMDSRLSSQGYEGLHISGIRYRVDFPVTSPLPLITFVRVNDEDLCNSGVDPDPTHIKLGSFKTTIKLQHVLTLNNYGDFYPRPPSGPFGAFQGDYPKHPTTPTADQKHKPPSGPFGAYQGDYTKKPSTPAVDEKIKGKGIDIYKIHSKAVGEHSDSDESYDEDDDEQNHKAGAAQKDVIKPKGKQTLRQEATNIRGKTVVQQSTTVRPRRKREYYENNSG